MKSICVFLGANPGKNESYAEAARNMGREIASRGMTTIYGGSNMGLMGILADGALEAGGKVIGVIPDSLVRKEVSHEGISELHVVSSMHERKSMMAKISDGFIAMPGGIGTLDEFFEIFTWAQLGFHKKPCGLLNVGGYYNKLLTFLDTVVEEGFLKEVHKNMVIMGESPAEIIDAFGSYVAPSVTKWTEKEIQDESARH